MSRNRYETDDRLLDAIEAISGGSLDCAGRCENPNCDGTHPENCSDSAVALWRDGGEDDRLRSWLDEHHPGWRDDAPLAWGAEEFE